VTPGLEAHSGAFLFNCAVQPTNNPQAEDLELAAQLWAKTEADLEAVRARIASARTA
jgi:hypothetical protein